MEVPDYYDAVSVRLMKVLDTTELAEKIRWKRIEIWTQAEELILVGCSENKANFHILGSQAEATTTAGLRSDIDMIFVHHETVLQDLQYWEPGSRTYLMIADNITPPGYVKLQQVYNEIPVLIFNIQTERLMLDRYGRSRISNNSRYFKLDISYEHHGPANALKHYHVLKSTDYVIAFRILSWPYTASEWITRNRKHNWPSQETIFIIHQSGTLLVPVGQKSSPERHLEWRISLSYGEKILVWQFNSTQYRCYVLLKMINKYFIKPIFGENVLTSYHWKTCMFYMLEATPTVLWQPQNLLLCIELCLVKVCTWIEECNCPNYFIATENMFLDKVYGPVQRNMADILHHLFRQKGRYLTMIPYDGIGQKLNIACQSPITQINDKMEDISKSMLLSVLLILLNIKKTWFELLRDGFQINSRVYEKLSSLHPVRKEIFTILLKLYCSNLGSHLASQCLKQTIIDQIGLDMAYEFLLLGSSSDVASGKLKLATFHLLQNNAILAENVLQNIEETYTFLVSNVATGKIKDPLILRIVNENISTTDIIRYYSAFPVPYLPSEMYCTPRALIPEMFRLTGSHQGSLDPDLDFWMSWAVVDPKLYLHYLQHQCYHQQNKISHKMVALGNMIWVIRHESLEYKDTALNVLAYSLKEDGLLVQSYAVLSKSMKLINNHNAAKWQVACLVNAAFKWLGGRY